MSGTELIRAYSGLTRILAPLLPLWIKRRALKGKEDPARQGERFGKTTTARPQGQLFWMHGASVGETTMLLPLIKKLLEHYPAAHLLVTSGTVTSANLMTERLPERAIHQYVPLDTPKAVEAFLDHWKPDAAFWAESEIWPNLITHTKSRNIPMALINARMSEKSIQGWAKRKATAKTLFGAFDVILPANVNTANGLSWLLDTEIEQAGNLKDAAPKLPVNQIELDKLQTQINNRPVWCAASTHKGEEEIVINAHKDILKKHPNAVLILALRHPNRRDEVRPILSGMDYVLRSEDSSITASTSILLFDTIGEMGLAYSLSDVSFVCGSLVKGLMGHNPLEPARFKNAVLTGGHIASFADSYMQMFAFDAAQRILAPNMVGQAVNALLSNPEKRMEMQNRAYDFAISREVVLDHLWEKILPILPSLETTS